MENKYYNKLKKQSGYYELNMENFNEFIDLMRPDNLNINTLMTKLRYEANPDSFDLSYIGKIQVPFPSSIDNSIVYRGHGDSEWSLTPTLDRQNNANKCFFRNPIFNQEREYNLLRNFQNSCDLAGVHLPSDGNEIRQKQVSTSEEFFDSVFFQEEKVDWFYHDFFELAAFAQHYGVPTRLLDWSKNPFVACYFANSYALERELDPVKKTSIWVLNFANMSNEIKNVLKVLDLPKGVNQHISHQQGVLTYTELNTEILPLLISKINNDEEDSKSLSLEEILEFYGNGYRLVKINLGYENVTKLYRYCMAHNFNACNLFRGAHGAAIHTRDVMNYEKFEIYE